MPPLCVDVLAPRNRRKDISEKVGAYLAAGAQEVILVETDARIHYFTMAGEQPGNTFGLRLTLPPGTYPL